jgi:hypothetical protein
MICRRNAYRAETTRLERDIGKLDLQQAVELRIEGKRHHYRK